MTMTCGTLIRRWTPFCLAAVFLVSGCEGYTRDTVQTPLKSQRAAAVHRKPAVHPAAPEEVSAQAAMPVRDSQDTAGGLPYVGLAESQLVARLGRPSAEREDQPPGKTWRYHVKSCIVDIMLYPDVETRTYRALAYEVINDDQSVSGKRLCLAELEARAHEQ